MPPLESYIIEWTKFLETLGGLLKTRVSGDFSKLPMLPTKHASINTLSAKGTAGKLLMGRVSWKQEIVFFSVHIFAYLYSRFLMTLGSFFCLRLPHDMWTCWLKPTHDWWWQQTAKFLFGDHVSKRFQPGTWFSNRETKNISQETAQAMAVVLVRSVSLYLNKHTPAPYIHCLKGLCLSLSRPLGSKGLPSEISHLLVFFNYIPE